MGWKFPTFIIPIPAPQEWWDVHEFSFFVHQVLSPFTDRQRHLLTLPATLKEPMQTQSPSV